MGRLLFTLPTVGPGDAVRIDTASGSNTPADIVPAGGGPAITGAVLHAGEVGQLPRLLGPADGTATLYLKQLNYRGTVTGSPVTLTGVDLAAAPSSPGTSSPARLAGTATTIAPLPFVNAADFTGFAADGTTDCTAAINAAIASLASFGGGEVRLPAGNILVGSSPGITLAENVQLVGTGRGTSIVQGYWPGQFIGLVSATGTYTNADVTGATLSADVAAGVKILALTSTANLTVGEMYLLGSDRAYMNAATSSSNDQLRNRGELVRIASIDSGTQVTLTNTTRDDYATADAASLRSVTFLKGVGVRDLRIVNPAPNAHQGDLIKLSYCKNFSVQNVTLEAADGVGVHLDMCIDGQVNGAHILDLTDNTGAGRYGYGVLANRATENVTITNVRVRGGRHAFTTNGVDNRRGVPRNIVLSGCVSENSSADAFDTHVQGANITFIGCSVSGAPLNAAAFQIRSPSTRIVGCSTDFVGYAVATNTYAHGCSIIGNTFRHSLTYGQAGGGPLVLITGGKHIVVKGNVLDGAYVDAIRVTGACDGLTIDGNTIQNPSARTSGDPAIVLQSGCTAADVRIIGNRILDFSALTDEAKSSGAITYPVDCQTTTTGYTIADNVAIGASQAAFVGTNTTGHTLRNNRQLDRVNGAVELYVAGSAPADAALATGEASVYYDSTTNAHALKVKAKNAAGTVVTPPPLNAEVIGVALSDETTALTTGTAKATIRMPFPMFVTGVRASVTTASSSGLPTVDIKESGTSILSTLLTINATAKTSTTATTPAVISDTLLADDAEMTFDVTVAGTGTTGLKVWLLGYRLA